MKVLTIAAMIALTAAAGVANATGDAPITRAQVVAQLHQAQAQGLMSTGEEAYPVEVPSSSSLTRSQVLAELQTAQQQGYISVGEATQYPQIAHQSDKSREQVVAELNAYAANHSDFVAA